MNMNNTITVTSKGRMTLPVAARRFLGLGQSGGTLRIRFDETKGELIISKPVSTDELNQS